MPNSDVSSRNARAWGQGLMTEALHAALKFSFEEVELNRIQAIIDSKNTRSMNLFTGLASRKKIFGKGSYFNRQFRDDVIFSLLRNGQDLSTFAGRYHQRTGGSNPTPRTKYAET